MKKLIPFLFFTVITCLVIGFNIADNTPTKSNFTDHTWTPIPSSNLSAVYTDNMDGANDTNALKARGYKVYYRGTGPQGLTATWFQGNSTVFNAYNGPATGYTAANYQVVTGTNTIDSWLVLPYISGGLLAGDTISFWERSTDGTFPDSTWVMFSVSDSVPEGTTWVVLGRFMNSITNAYQQRRYVAPSNAPNGRFAIRYHVVGGGPSGLYSDYIGIDAINVFRTTVGITGNNNNVPSAFSMSQNYPNPFNPTTTFTFALPAAGNTKLTVYDMLGNEIEVVVNEYKQAGTYTVNFYASKYSSGVYFYTLISGSFKDTKKMTLVK